MREIRLRLGLVVLAGAVLTACVDSPTAATAPADENQLAGSFDALAQEQTVAGDVERSEDFRWAALALRAGVAPTRFDVTVDGTLESFSAFVHTVDWILPTLAMRPAGHRTFVAWRTDGGLMQVIIISSHTETATVMHPYSMRPSQPGSPILSPVAGALAAYFERGSSKSAWIGVGGEVQIAEKSTDGACHAPNASAAPVGITCQLATYGVRFGITVEETQSFENRDLRQVAVTKKLDAASQDVAGVKLTFSCAMPASDKGCR